MEATVYFVKLVLFLKDACVKSAAHDGFRSLQKFFSELPGHVLKHTQIGKGQSQKTHKSLMLRQTD